MIVNPGDIVTIKDGSYMETFYDGKWNNCGKPDSSTRTIGWCKDKWQIRDTGSFPLHFEHTNYSRPNNVRMVNGLNGEVWYCHSDINLRLETASSQYISNDLELKEEIKFNL